jgi:hypothetical protein
VLVDNTFNFNWRFGMETAIIIKDVATALVFIIAAIWVWKLF